jgi:hypothetical protein
MTPEQVELLTYIVARAIEAAARSIAAFQEVNGRAPTLEEWKALEARWRSPEEIEAAVRAGIADGGKQ